eukprot:GAHX01000559.1.p1 GENE.GAHX01000559.1~~GAHX01000559.1.p1  ORF type:complete len:377 (+),score=67.91 GAHX01000559.1:40-1170(+)
MGIFHSTQIMGSIDFSDIISSLETNKPININENKTDKLVVNRLKMINLDFSNIVTNFQSYSPFEDRIKEHMAFKRKFKEENDEEAEDFDDRLEEAFEEHTNQLYIDLTSNIKELVFYQTFAKELVAALLEVLSLTFNFTLSQKPSKTGSVKQKKNLNNLTEKIEKITSEKIYLNEYLRLETFASVLLLIEKSNQFDIIKMNQVKLNLDLSYYRRLQRLATIEPPFKANLDNLTIFYSPWKPFFQYIWTILRNENMNDGLIAIQLTNLVNDCFNAIESGVFGVQETEKLLKEKGIGINSKLICYTMIRLICLLDHVELEGVFLKESKLEIKEILKRMKKSWYDIEEVSTLLAEIENNVMHLDDKKTSSGIRKLFESK